MSELSELYQDTILEHNKNPRNFRAIEQHADGVALGADDRREEVTLLNVAEWRFGHGC